MRRVHRLSVELLRENLLFAPIGWEEFVGLYRPLRRVPAGRAELDGRVGRGARGIRLRGPDVLAGARVSGTADTVVLETLATRPDLRGRGVGQALAAQCLAGARQRGYRHVIFALIRAGNRRDASSRPTGRRSALRPFRAGARGPMNVYAHSDGAGSNAAGSGRLPSSGGGAGSGRRVSGSWTRILPCGGHAAFRGPAPGDPVLVFVPMSIELYVALLAIFRPRSGRRSSSTRRPGAATSSAAAGNCRIRALIASPKAHLLRCAVPALRRMPVAFATGPLRLPGSGRWRDWRRFGPDGDPDRCAADTAALITFTSGSTGRPKAAVRTHGLLQRRSRPSFSAELAAPPGNWS